MFASGVIVATAFDGEVAHAITATAFCSLSLEPPMILLSVRSSGQLIDLARRAGCFGVSVLAAGQRALGEWAATTGRVPERTLAPWETHVATTGAPLITGAAAWFDCRLETMADYGDHTILIGLVVETRADENAQPLLYFRGGFHGLGERMGGDTTTGDA